MTPQDLKPTKEVRSKLRSLRASAEASAQHADDNGRHRAACEWWSVVVLLDGLEQGELYFLQARLELK